MLTEFALSVEEYAALGEGTLALIWCLAVVLHLGFVICVIAYLASLNEKYEYLAAHLAGRDKRLGRLEAVVFPVKRGARKCSGKD